MEVLTAYSHTPDLFDDLRKAVEIVRRHGPDDPDDGHNEDASRPSLRTLADRLSPQDAQTITDLYHGGTPTKDLAAKFGISARSVRRLIKKHSAGLSDRQDTVIEGIDLIIEHSLRAASRRLPYPRVPYSGQRDRPTGLNTRLYAAL